MLSFLKDHLGTSCRMLSTDYDLNAVEAKFVWLGWTVSDKYHTENSGLLDNLVPGDTVLADCGLT